MLALRADGKGVGMRDGMIQSEYILLLLAAVLSLAWGLMVVL
jgi:hypothetical protein